jgi:hypothetical protein
VSVDVGPDRIAAEPRSATSAPAAERAPAWMEGDAAEQLEELVGTVERRGSPVSVDGHQIEIVGPHLRVSGWVQLGYHRRLSDYINNHLGLIVLNEATVLRRNGEATRVYAPSIWINLDDVTLVGQLVDDRPPGASDIARVEKHLHTVIAVTQGHTLTGDMHLLPEAVLAGYVESPEPRFVALTDVRTRSLADRRIITRYAFALLNRRHIVAITALQPGMIRGRGAI